MILDEWQVNLIKQINTIFKRHRNPLSFAFLLQKYKKFYKFNKKQFFSTVDLMIEKELIKKTKSDKLVLAYEWVPSDLTTIIVGKIHVFLSGSALISVIEKNENEKNEEVRYFVHRSNLAGAIDGDIVKAGLIVKEKDDSRFKMSEAVVIEINEHTKTRFVGTYLIDQKNLSGYHVLPDSFRTELKIQLDDLNGLQNGDKIYFEIYEFFSDFVKARLIKRIGTSLAVETEIESILLENNVSLTFPDETIIEAQQICLHNNLKNDSDNWPMINFPFITIDPVSARDYDDAIYVEKNSDNTYRLVVAIAAVSAYVQSDSKLDLCAKKRCYSIYLYDRVIPMLPSSISDELCSLTENDIKKVYVVDLHIDNNGNFINYKIYPALIRNHRRCNYDEINELISNNLVCKNKCFDDNLINLIKTANELFDILVRFKTQQGLIGFDFPEVKPFYNPTLNEIEIKIKKHGIAEKIVESFMIAANEAVGLYAKKFNLPFIYRVHPGPKKELIPDFLREIKKIGIDHVEIDFLNATSKELTDWLNSQKNHAHFGLLNRLVLRVLGKAHYSCENTQHFALAAKNYTHFTSPIRRYADLIVHRILEWFVFNLSEHNDFERKKIITQLPHLCQVISELEVKSADIERKVDTLLFCYYMEKRIGNTYAGTIIMVQNFGMFIELENMIEGFVHITKVSEKDFFTYCEEEACLIGEKSGKKYCFGDKVKVNVIGVDMRSLRINLKIVTD